VSSNLSRLFAYARAEGNRPRENFTTEALAAAIRHDPSPMLAALADRGVLDPTAVRSLAPFTQVTFAGAGIVDLLLLVGSEEGDQQVWIEVKVDAGLSGHQLDHYRQSIDNATDSVRRDLVLLSSSAIGTRVPHVALRWREVAAAALRLAPDHPSWTDLVNYLREIGMTNRAYPITLRESAALDDAVGLYRKAVAAIAATNQRLREEGFAKWVRAERGSTAWANQRVGQQWRQRGRLMAFGSNRYKGWILYGFYSRDGETFAAVWLEVDPKRTGERTSVREQSDSGGLDASWLRPLDSARWQVLTKEERAIAFESEDATTEWFVACHRELRDAGVLDLIPRLGTVPPEEVAAADADEDAEPDADGDDAP
jgi:hypothetical protein